LYISRFSPAVSAPRGGRAAEPRARDLDLDAHLDLLRAVVLLDQLEADLVRRRLRRHV
jgi:hypothetical protein